MSDFANERKRMVLEQIYGRGVRDPRVLKAMATVRREAFVPERLQHLAYADTPLPIASGQTISQPYIVAYMIEALASCCNSGIIVHRRRPCGTFVQLKPI